MNSSQLVTRDNNGNIFSNMSCSGSAAPSVFIFKPCNDLVQHTKLVSQMFIRSTMSFSQKVEGKLSFLRSLNLIVFENLVHQSG